MELSWLAFEFTFLAFEFTFLDSQKSTAQLYIV